MPDNIKRALVRAVLHGAAWLQRLLCGVSFGRLPPFCSVLALIENQGKILVVHHTVHDRYTFPGGYLRLHESPPQALRRELLEEAGMDVEPLEVIGAYRNAAGVASINLVYRCATRSGIGTCNYEGQCEWLAAEEVMDRLIDHCQSALRDFLGAGQASGPAAGPSGRRGVRPGPGQL